MPDIVAKTTYSRYLIVLATAALSVAALLLMRSALQDRLARAGHERELASIAAVLPAELYDNDPLADRIDVHDRASFGADTTTVLRARLHGQASAVVLRATVPKGYSGPIELLIGLRSDGSVLGVRVTTHRETPGLGDAIEQVGDGAWIRAFDGKSLNRPLPEQWAVQRDSGDFDQISGATVTARAIVVQMKKILMYFSAHRNELFALKVP
ncbi:MAG: RnfABCDGE type electron transport complex subunit G [Tahibacter sp.]